MPVPLCTHPEHADYAGKPWATGMWRPCWLLHNHPNLSGSVELATKAGLELPDTLRILTPEEKAQRKENLTRWIEAAAAAPEAPTAATVATVAAQSTPAKPGGCGCGGNGLTPEQQRVRTQQIHEALQHRREAVRRATGVSTT